MVNGALFEVIIILALKQVIDIEQSFEKALRHQNKYGSRADISYKLRALHRKGIKSGRALKKILKAFPIVLHMPAFREKMLPRPGTATLLSPLRNRSVA
jgi:hypothetical protein